MIRFPTGYKRHGIFYFNPFLCLGTFITIILNKFKYN